MSWQRKTGFIFIYIDLIQGAHCDARLSSVTDEMFESVTLHYRWMLAVREWLNITCVCSWWRSTFILFCVIIVLELHFTELYIETVIYLLIKKSVHGVSCSFFSIDLRFGMSTYGTFTVFMSCDWDCSTITICIYSLSQKCPQLA